MVFMTYDWMLNNPKTYPDFDNIPRASSTVLHEWFHTYGCDHNCNPWNDIMCGGAGMDRLENGLILSPECEANFLADKKKTPDFKYHKCDWEGKTSTRTCGNKKQVNLICTNGYITATDICEEYGDLYDREKHLFTLCGDQTLIATHDLLEDGSLVSTGKSCE
jgi:hypothetical protein